MVALNPGRDAGLTQHVLLVHPNSELVKTKKKLEDYHNSASMHDQLVRELQARESDLSESLAAKDSQLAVLRVRLEEADRSVKEREKQIEDLQSHRERWVHCYC